jgi:hypothetical protein
VPPPSLLVARRQGFLIPTSHPAIPLMRVNSTNVLDEGLKIGEIGRRMNSKVKLVEIGMRRK